MHWCESWFFRRCIRFQKWSALFQLIHLRTFLALEEAAMTVFMEDLTQQVVSSASPYLWSLVLAFATVLISIALLYLARFSAKLEVKDLADLRSMFDRFPAWGKRASWAQQNSFEAFSLHAPAALLAAIAALNGQTLPSVASLAAFAYPVLRLAYICAYVFNVPLARSLCWLLGLLCSGVLYGVGLSALLA